MYRKGGCVFFFNIVISVRFLQLKKKHGIPSTRKPFYQVSCTVRDSTCPGGTWQLFPWCFHPDNCWICRKQRILSIWCYSKLILLSHLSHFDLFILSFSFLFCYCAEECKHSCWVTSPFRQLQVWSISSETSCVHGLYRFSITLYWFWESCLCRTTWKWEESWRYNYCHLMLTQLQWLEISIVLFHMEAFFCLCDKPNLYDVILIHMILFFLYNCFSDVWGAKGQVFVDIFLSDIHVVQ